MDYRELKRCRTCRKDLPAVFFGQNTTQCSVCRRIGPPNKTEPPPFRTCDKCGEEKPIDKFKKDRSRADGRALSCRFCLNVHRRKESDSYKNLNRRKRRAKRHWRHTCKARLIEHRGGACVDCQLRPSDEWPVGCFDFHHTDPTQKDFAVAQSRGRVTPELLQEVEKCVVLCANCHRRRHANEEVEALERDVPTHSSRQAKALELMSQGWELVGLPDTEAGLLVKEGEDKILVQALAMRGLHKIGMLTLVSTDEYGVRHYVKADSIPLSTIGDTCNVQPSAGVPSPSSGSPSGMTLSA